MEFFIKVLFRAVPVLVSFALFILFLAPFTAGIVNLGNCAGAAVTGILMFVFIFWNPFRNFVIQLWKSPGGKILVCSAAVFISFCIISASVISIFMVRAMNDSPKGRNTTLLLLGCKVKDGAPSLMLKRRINAAYDYLAEYGDTRIIVSGGQGSDESISEAQCMRDELVSMGIAPERIYMEDKSTNTEENLKFSHEIIRNEKLEEKITIVTDGFHQLRAEMIAGKLGMNAYNISAETPDWLLISYWVREWFGVAYYFLFG